MSNSVGKKKSNRENIWQAIFSSIDQFDFDNIYHCLKISSNSKIK